MPGDPFDGMPPTPDPNIRALRLSQRIESPHEKSPCDLSTSTIHSITITVRTIEECVLIQNNSNDCDLPSQMKGEDIPSPDMTSPILETNVMSDLSALAKSFAPIDSTHKSPSGRTLIYFFDSRTNDLQG